MAGITKMHHNHVILASVVDPNDEHHQKILIGTIGQDGKPVDLDSRRGLPVSLVAGQRDAFGRLRVSNPESRWDSSNIYEKDPAFGDSLTGTATSTHNYDHAAVELATAADGDEAVRQSFRHVAYQPGKSQLAFLTFNAYGNEANATKRVGLFDDGNGIFLEVGPTETSFVIRTDTSGTASDAKKVDRSEWNLDPMDGTGPSGFTLDITKAQILAIDYEWLGIGRVRVGFVINGAIRYVHAFHTANIGTAVYMRTPHLPIRYEIVQTGAGSFQLDQICSSVVSEGGRENISLPRSHLATTARAVTNSAWLPILSIRPKTTYQGQTNRKSIRLACASIIATTPSDILLMRVRFGATLTNATFAVDPGTFYAAEVDIAATAAAGGIVVHSASIGAESSVSLGELLDNVVASLDVDGNHPTSPLSDIITIEVRSASVNADALAGLTWFEEGV